MLTLGELSILPVAIRPSDVFTYPSKLRLPVTPGAGMSKPRILLADDHLLVLDGYCKLLEPQFEIVGMVSDGRELLRVAPTLQPDVILLDIGMPALNGIDAGRQLKKMLPDCRIILLTVNADYELAVDALRNWASGYFLKTSTGQELLRAIREVLRGGKFLAPQFAVRQTEEFVRDPRLGREKHMTLRQREVLQLLSEGLSMKEVAAELRVTTRTVAFHKYEIMDKYGLKNNADLLLFAIKQHVLAGPPN
jgi:DNA-binding NarL/FixJ family response regulator